MTIITVPTSRRHGVSFIDNPHLSLTYESLLCNHPHAIAKIPINEAYSIPLINIAILMMFLLPGNVYGSSSPEVVS